MSLKTDYTDDKYAGRRKYIMIQNDDSTISLDDVTVYEEEGDTFSGGDINATNIAVNANTAKGKKIDKMSSARAFTLESSKWSVAAPYIQTLNISGVSENDVVDVALYKGDNPTEEISRAREKAYSNLDRVVTGNSTITFYCLYNKPTTDFPVLVKGVL